MKPCVNPPLQTCPYLLSCTHQLKPIVFEHVADHKHRDGPHISHDQAVHNEDNDEGSDGHDIEQHQDDSLDNSCINIINSLDTHISGLNHEYISQVFSLVQVLVSSLLFD